MTPWTQSLWILGGFCCLGILAIPPLTIGFTDADRRTLDMLQEQAEHAISQGDPDGAALTIGKAALFTSQIARDISDTSSGQIEHTLASLYRTQEHTYRAIALFQQGGSQTPASFGVCQTVAQGMAQSAQSKTLLEAQTGDQTSKASLGQQIKEWEEMLQELEKEFGCTR